MRATSFTAEELEELRRFDAEVDAAEMAEEDTGSLVSSMTCCSHRRLRRGSGNGLTTWRTGSGFWRKTVLGGRPSLRKRLLVRPVGIRRIRPG